MCHERKVKSERKKLNENFSFFRLFFSSQTIKYPFVCFSQWKKYAIGDLMRFFSTIPTVRSRQHVLNWRIRWISSCWLFENGKITARNGKVGKENEIMLENWWKLWKISLFLDLRWMKWINNRQHVSSFCLIFFNFPTLNSTCVFNFYFHKHSLWKIIVGKNIFIFRNEKLLTTLTDRYELLQNEWKIFSKNYFTTVKLK